MQNDFNLPHPDSCVKCGGKAKESLMRTSAYGYETPTVFDTVLTPCLECQSCGHTWQESSPMREARIVRNTLNKVYNRINPMIVRWGTSTVSFDVNAPENADKLNTLVEAGF